jgi:protease-4
VAVVDGLAASGGYIAALGADQVVARGSSLVGSIGVLVQYPNVAELLRSLGVKVEEVKSTPLKAAPNGFEPTSPEARAALEVIVRDNYDWFRNLVRERRQISGAELERVADGRVFTGRQAADMRLIDRLGDTSTARDWLAEARSIARTTPVRTWKVRERLGDLGFLHLVAHAIADAAGLTALAERIAGSSAVTALDRLGLDGVLAVWHPPTSP